jgi:O-antigen/teichoic acid export membrane protein
MSFEAEATVTPAKANLGSLLDSTASLVREKHPRSGVSESFSSQTVRGGAYLAARYGFGVAVSTGNMLVMTRWIGPHAYGLFVTAIGLVAFLSTMARAGVDIYLVRHEETPDVHMYEVAATLILGTSIALAVTGVAVTPLLVRWYGSHEFVRPYLILLLTVPVTGLTGVPMAKLERTLNFGTVAGIELAGQTLGLAVSAMFAWSRPGVWAPVAGQLAWQTHVLIAACASARIVPRFRFDADQVSEMLLFGVGLTASLRIWQLRTLVNPLLVGRFVGAEGVAFVALALRITEALGAFRLAAGRMAIAALARLQNQPEKFRCALEGALYWQVITLGPLLCAFSLLGPFIVRHAIGVRWTPSLTIYPFVAVGVLVNSVYNLQASSLFVTGRQWTVMRSYSSHVMLLAMGTLLLVPHFGIAGYGWSELLACAAYFLIHTGLAESTVISYRRLVPWVAIFIAILSVRH